MPRILRILNRFNLGGPVYNAAYLTRYLAPEFETMLIGGPPLPDEEDANFILQELGIEYHVLPSMRRSIHPWADLTTLSKIRKLIRKFRPDIIHTHAAKAGALGRIAGYLEKVPVIVHTFHGNVFSDYFSPWKSNLIQKTERWLAKKTTAIVVISEKQQRDIVSKHQICSAEQTYIIPLGLNLDKFNIDKESKRTAFRSQYGISEQEMAIGIIGRMAPVKNHGLFFDAIKILLENYTNFKAVVIGDGSSKAHWLHYTFKLNIERHVVFTSWVKEIDCAMAGLDMVVLTSHNEGTPLSLIEAQAASLPVISTDVGGVSDCMQDGITGHLVQAGDAKALADAMLELAVNVPKAHQFSAAGKAFVNKKYGYQRLVSDHRKMYNTLLKNK